jgi:hypothetical protein
MEYGGWRVVLNPRNCEICRQNYFEKVMVSWASGYEICCSHNRTLDWSESTPTRAHHRRALDTVAFDLLHNISNEERLRVLPFTHSLEYHEL